ncbi:hypothetical protein BKA70DRAFT_1420245 [Coprinopsis sp. MPI-PUGE-AT-0042]|nr:hypothetical protein BKA70DRAFT_1420245 [Coprinopsis sp. MPI-PUGE-AT-0042]
MYSPPSSPQARRKPSNPIPGFRPAPRQRRPIEDMTIRELQDLHNLNTRILSSPDASSSSYALRVQREQAMIESRLLDLDGVEKLNTSLRRTRIKAEGDTAPEPAEPKISRTMEAKRRALAQYGSAAQTGASSGMSMQEAIQLEQQGHMIERERQERLLEKRRRQGLPIRGEVLTREEQEARIWAFMMHKPTDSDLEDEDDDSDDEDPASWFDDDQDDGIKGQDIVDPDFEDNLGDMIQVDTTRIPNQYGNNFYPEHNR